MRQGIRIEDMVVTMGLGGGRAQPGRQVGHGKLPREAGKILRSKCSQGPILSQVWWWGGEADGQGP